MANTSGLDHGSRGLGSDIGGDRWHPGEREGERDA